MKNISFLLLTLLIFTRAYAQLPTDAKTLGDKAFRNKNYYEAAFYYKKSAQGLNIIKQVETPYHGSENTRKSGAPVDRAYISYMLAESYRLYENYLEAEAWYYNVINENFETKYPLARLYYGICLHADQHFDEAIKQLTQFSVGYKGDSKNIQLAQREIANCKFAKEQYPFPQLMDVVKMKGVWNSDGSDYAMVKRDKNFYFTSSRIIKDDKKHLNRIYTSTAADAFKPELLTFKSDENKAELEYGTATFSPKGNRMYFTRWYKEGAKTIHAIYKSERTNNEWAKPVKLNTNVNVDGFNSIQPFVTADGKEMYYASNKPGGQGGDDIWVSDLDADGNPLNSNNLGASVNSAEDEQAPYYDAADKKLIYSSKGFIGLGGFDFFESTADQGQWSSAQNMGYPMNSAKDDLYYYPDNSDSHKFYISSDRASDCCLDLFEVYDNRHILSGLVVDCDTHKPLSGAKVSFIDSLSKKTLKEETMDESGKYVFTVSTKRPYALVIQKDEYFTKVVPVPTNGTMLKDTLVNPDICLQAFKVNKPIVLRNILYDYNKATLREESKVELNKLVVILKDNPNIKVELSSHTDSIGSDVYNLKLSQERAQTCVDYMIASGIEESRIFPKGYGRSKPIAPNSLPDGKDNPDGRQLNRRTEFTVLKQEQI